MDELRDYWRDHGFLVSVVAALLVSFIIALFASFHCVDGHIIDDETREAIDDADASIGGERLEIDSRGKFDLWALGSGRHELTVTHWRYKTVRRQVDVNSNLDRIALLFRRAFTYVTSLGTPVGMG